MPPRPVSSSTAPPDAEVVARIAQGRLPSPIPVRRRRDPRPYLLPAVALVAGVAAVAIFHLGRGRTPPAIVARGDVTLSVEVDGGGDGDGDAARRLGDGDEVHAGDRLRLEVHAPQAGHMAILSMDSQGVSVRHPFAAAAPALYDPARPVVPATLLVDDRPGVERFYLVYAHEPFSLEEATHAVASGGPLPPHLSAATLYLVKTK